MKFLVGFSICAEDREVIEVILQKIGELYKISDAKVHTLGPEKREDNYRPKLTVIERDRGWCLQVDGEDQVIGIPPMGEKEEYELRRDKAFEVSSTKTVEEHRDRVKNLFLLILQFNLGDYSYFETFDEAERMRALVSFSFHYPLSILSEEQREAAMRGEIPDLDCPIPPKDQMN